MNRISSLYLIIACLAFSGVFAQNAPVSQIGAVSGYGPEIIVPVTASNISNIAGCNQQFFYDPEKVLAAEVTKGAQLPGMLSFNVNTPGVITIGWFTWPGVTLPDNSVLFNIKFNKVGYGTSPVIWNTAYPDRNWSDANAVILNDIPVEDYYFDGAVTFLSTNAPQTSIGAFTACPSTLIEIPVSVSDFNNIGAFTLTLQYDLQALNYLSFSNTSGFPGMNVSISNPGELTASGSSTAGPGVSLPDNSTLFTLLFSTVGNSSSLEWFDNGVSCEYKGPAPLFMVLNDFPQSEFYMDGLFTVQPAPGAVGTISGPAGGVVCKWQENVIFSIEPVPNATFYDWNMPTGAVITGGLGTHQITATFGSGAINGNVVVSAQNECGTGAGSPAFPIYVNEPPEITIQPYTPDTVNAGAGIAVFFVEASGTSLEYQWQEFNNSWENISDTGVYQGTRSSILIITNPPADMDGYYYRCIVSGFCDPPAITDGTAQLNIRIVTGTESNEAYYEKPCSLFITAGPNPFTNQIIFSCHIEEHGNLSIEFIYLSGVRTPETKYITVHPGKHMLCFQTDNFPLGIYLATARLNTSKHEFTCTLKLLKTDQCSSW